MVTFDVQKKYNFLHERMLRVEVDTLYFLSVVT